MIATLGALSSWLQQKVGDLQVKIGEGASQTVHAYSTDPTVTTLALFQIPLVPVLAILATISLIAAERESGTLAWSLTKPVSRTAVLVAKWSGAMLAFGLVALVIPIGVSAIASTLAYGSAPDMGIVTKTCGLYLAVPALLIALTLFAGVIIRSQATIAGLALFVMFAPALLGSFLPPHVVQAVPVGIGNWCSATSPVTPCRRPHRSLGPSPWPSYSAQASSCSSVRSSRTPWDEILGAFGSPSAVTSSHGVVRHPLCGYPPRCPEPDPRTEPPPSPR